MFLLLLKYHAASQDIFFATEEAALAALEGLKPKLGERYRNDEVTHTILAPSGPVVVVCSKVESASVIDVAKQDELVAATLRRRDDREIEFFERKEAAKARASRSVNI